MCNSLPTPTISLSHVFHMLVRHIHARRKIFWQVHQVESQYKYITENMLSGQKNVSLIYANRNSPSYKHCVTHELHESMLHATMLK